MVVAGSPRLQIRVLTTPVSLPCSTVSLPKSLSSGFGRNSRRRCTLILNNCQRSKRDGLELERWSEKKGSELERLSGKKGSELFLNSVSPFPLLMFLATLPGSEALKSALGPAIPLVRSFDLPDWLIHWGHPGNMAVVLFAMGGYGTYLGFRIRFSDDKEEIAKAKDLHPKLLGGMFFFFSLGALGGITSLLTSDKPILDSPHAVTAVIGLTLLTIQAILPSRFQVKLLNKSVDIMSDNV